MKLYSGPLSLFSRKVEIALAEKGIAYEREMVPFSQAAGYSPKHPQVLAANPKGQVPVLVDSDLTLFDSTLIMEYLDDAYPAPALRPADVAGRARCRLLELTADEILLPLIARLMYRTEPADPNPIRQADKERAGAAAETEIEAFYGGLDDRLDGQEYLCGEFSVADIAIFMDLLFAKRLGGPSLVPYRILTAWYARVAARASVAPVVREVAKADEELSQ